MSEILDARAKSMIATIEARTGKTAQDFVALAIAEGLGDPAVKPGVRIAWLKQSFGLGHGHAMAHAIEEALKGKESR
jgi:hypothetical protein